MSVADGLNADFRDLLEVFAEAEVQFMLVGAHALAAHGIVRSTGDLDVWVNPQPDNARRVVAALARFGAPLAQHGVTSADFERLGTVYQLGLPPRRIDVLTSISGVAFDEAWPQRVEVPLGAHALMVLGREALLANKRAAGRPKDLLDVEALERHPPPR